MARRASQRRRTGPVHHTGRRGDGRLISAVRYRNVVCNAPEGANCRTRQFTALTAWVRMGRRGQLMPPRSRGRQDFDLVARKSAHCALAADAANGSPHVRARLGRSRRSITSAGEAADKGLRPPAGDKATLLRRGTFDLTA